ncbi:aryl-alcohol dehydrogenase-like predicted oxidoreductase [Labrys wisconsinensis]|uniref:Aryl-alcohol dehydrogenase-like predicted oxidoreductase n=1 Tax=Labrys wisconsinensis TaxID=425677 RepID=A0ABU0JAU9_9HYPH|nr:aryl-alcohol dehydrogenase-like predicted oxidoreductase [Labrys wisconsinensis]
MPIALEEGLGVLVWSPLAGGLLSGKFRRGQPAPAGTRQVTDWNEPPVRDPEALFDIVEALIAIGARRGVSAAQVALAYMLRRPAVSSLVIGARTSEQLADNLAAADLVLGDDDVAELDALSKPPLIYPYWHHVRAATDRLGSSDLSLLRPYL